MSKVKLTVLGVDPGLTGGLAIFEVGMSAGKLSSVALIDSLKMPVCWSYRYKTKKSKRIDVRELDGILTSYNVDYSFVEFVSAMPAMIKGKTVQGAASTFDFGYGTGTMEAVLYLRDLPITYVTPVVWKRYHKLLKTEKIASVHHANELWPDFEFTRPCHSGRADAALIGFYGIACLPNLLGDSIEKE